MVRKVFRWVIMSEAEYRKLTECKGTIRALNDVMLSLIEMVTDLIRRL